MALCKKCAENTGNPYTFYYGDKLSEETVSEKAGVIGAKRHSVLTEYKIAGKKSEVICEPCINKRKSGSIALGFGVGGVLTAAFVAMLLLMPAGGTLPDWFELIWCLNLAGLLAAAYLFNLGFKGIKQTPREFGEEIAIALNKKSLSKEHARFWTATKYESMHSKK